MGVKYSFNDSGLIVTKNVKILLHISARDVGKIVVTIVLNSTNAKVTMQCRLLIHPEQAYADIWDRINENGNSSG